MAQPCVRNTVARRRRNPRSRWVLAAVIVFGVVLLVVGLCWLVGLRRAEWNGALGAVETAVSHAPSPGGLYTRDRANLGLAWQGAGQADLGRFSVLNYDTATRTHMLSQFHLKGKTGCDSAGDFQSLMDGNRRRFREQVAIAIRNCQPEDLAPKNLDLLKKKIIAQVNLALGREFLQALEIEEFLVYESVDQRTFVLQDNEP